MSEKHSVMREVDALMEQVRPLKPGGDWDTLIEGGVAKIKQAAYEQAVEERRQWEHQADFPLSAM